MFFMTQFILPFFQDLNAIFPLSLLWPFLFVFSLIRAIRSAVRDEPYLLTGILAGFSLLVLLSPIIGH